MNSQINYYCEVCKDPYILCSSCYVKRVDNKSSLLYGILKKEEISTRLSTVILSSFANDTGVHCDEIAIEISNMNIDKLNKILRNKSKMTVEVIEYLLKHIVCDIIDIKLEYRGEEACARMASKLYKKCQKDALRWKDDFCENKNIFVVYLYDEHDKDVDVNNISKYVCICDHKLMLINDETVDKNIGVCNLHRGKHSRSRSRSMLKKEYNSQIFQKQIKKRKKQIKTRKSTETNFGGNVGFDYDEIAIEIYCQDLNQRWVQYNTKYNSVELQSNESGENQLITDIVCLFCGIIQSLTLSSDEITFNEIKMKSIRNSAKKLFTKVKSAANEKFNKMIEATDYKQDFQDYKQDIDMNYLIQNITIVCQCLFKLQDEEAKKKQTNRSKNNYKNRCYCCECLIKTTTSIIPHWSCTHVIDDIYSDNGTAHIQVCKLCMKQIKYWAESNVFDDTLEEISESIFEQNTEYLVNAKLIKYGQGNPNENIDKDDPHIVRKFKDMKTVWVHPDNTDRTCFIELNVTRLTIDEKLENGNAECEIKMKIVLYWLFSEHEYAKYVKMSNSEKKRWQPEKIDEKEPWIPRLQFPHSIDREKDAEIVTTFGVKKFHDFFGDKYTQKMKGNAFKDSRASGYVGFIGRELTIKVLEPFELASFPFDCQDITFYIAPENFTKLAPAYPEKENENFVELSSEVSNLGLYSLEKTLVEFKFEQNGSNQMRCMLKLKRLWSSYLLQYAFLVASVSVLTLTAYTLDIEEKPDRVATVLGLLLALIFIEIPIVPDVTFLDWYYYVSFLYVVVIAIQCAIGDFGITDLLQNENDLWILNDSNHLWLVIFACVYVLYNIVFIIGASFTYAKEYEKISMTSEKIDSINKQMNKSVIRHEDKHNFHVELIEGNPLIDVYSSQQMDKYGNILKSLPNRFAAHKFKISLSTATGCQICIILFLMIFMFIGIFCLPILVSTMQLVLINSDSCVYINTNDTINNKGSISLVIFSFIQIIGMILLLLMIRGMCCFRNVSNNWCIGVALFQLIISIAMYLMAIYNFAFWYNDNNFVCDLNTLETAVKLSFVIWIILYSLIYIILLLFLEIFIKTQHDHDVYVCFWKCKRSFITLSQIGMTILLIVIQIPTAVIQLILISDPTTKCTDNNYVNINIFESTIFLLLVYVFIFIRIMSHHYSNIKPIYALCCPIIQIMTIHSFSYWSNVYFERTDCHVQYLQKHQGELAIYIYYMFGIWIIYDVTTNILYGITYLFGMVKHNSPYIQDWIWYIVFILLLTIQIPTAVIQLIMAWTTIQSNYLASVAIVIIISTSIVLIIYKYFWIKIIKDGKVSNSVVNVTKSRMTISLSLGVCFVLSLNSLILLSTNVFILWYLLLICVILYLILILFLCPFIFIRIKSIGFCTRPYRIFDNSDARNWRDHWINLLFEIIIFIVQIIASLLQLYLLQNESCGHQHDKNYQRTAIFLLIFTIFQFMPLFDISLSNGILKLFWNHKTCIGLILLAMNIASFAIIIDLIEFWSQFHTDIICNHDNIVTINVVKFLWFACILFYIIFGAWLVFSIFYSNNTESEIPYIPINNLRCHYNAHNYCELIGYFIDSYSSSYKIALKAEIYDQDVSRLKYSLLQIIYHDFDRGNRNMNRFKNRKNNKSDLSVQVSFNDWVETTGTKKALVTEMVYDFSDLIVSHPKLKQHKKSTIRFQYGGWDKYARFKTIIEDRKKPIFYYGHE